VFKHLIQLNLRKLHFTMPNLLNNKRKLGRWLAPLSVRTNRKVILIYHSVRASLPAVSDLRFKEQIEWLASNSRVVSIDELLRSDGQQGLEVAITFDDGYSSLHDVAAPVLQACGATATVYLNTGLIGERSRVRSDAGLGHYPDDEFMTWNDVIALKQAGWTVGSHGVEHLDLTVTAAESALDQLLRSKREIEDRLGISCAHFAYTWGRFNEPLQRMVRAAGYKTAVSCLHGPISDSSPTFALPRIDVRAEYEIEDFVSVVTGAWDYLGFKQRLFRRLP
jgi:peptidoglycan/xylan/chitin deacetylase (PgdA/CDA1 family)